GGVPVAARGKRRHEMAAEKSGAAGHDDAGIGTKPGTAGGGCHAWNLRVRARKVNVLGSLSSREARLRIGVDARKLRDGGIGTYIRNLLGIFFGRPEGHRFVVF